MYDGRATHASHSARETHSGHDGRDMMHSGYDGREMGSDSFVPTWDALQTDALHMGRLQVYDGRAAHAARETHSGRDGRQGYDARGISEEEREVLREMFAGGSYEGPEMVT